MSADAYVHQSAGIMTFGVCVCFQGSVRALLHDKIRDAYTHPQFVTDVMKPMQIESIIDQDVSTPVLVLFRSVLSRSFS